LAGTEGNRKKFDAAESPKFIGEGESVVGCDISVKDLCGQVLMSEQPKKIRAVGGVLPCGAEALETIYP